MTAKILYHPSALFAENTAARYNLHAYRTGMDCAERDFRYGFTPRPDAWRFETRDDAMRRAAFNSGYEVRFKELELERMKRVEKWNA